MKQIRITEQNRVAIFHILAGVNGRAVTHTFTTYQQIEQIAAQAEKQIIGLVGSQKAAVGARFEATSGDKVANAYKYVRIGTRVKLERRATGWFLIDAMEWMLYQNGGERRLSLTTAQDARAVEVLRTKYTIADEG